MSHNLLSDVSALVSRCPDLFAGLSPHDLAAIQEILSRNVSSGRVYRVAAGSSSPVELDEDQQRCYLEKVLACYRKECMRVQTLRARDNDAWRALSEALTATAYAMLRKRGCDPVWAEQNVGVFVQEACAKIFDSYYPFDVSFDAWANTILKNVILQFLTRSGDLLDREPHIGSVEELIETGDHHLFTSLIGASSPDDAAADTILQQGDDREGIVAALEQMRSEARRAIIVLTYFYDLDDDEIAERLGKSKGAIHSLRYRALRQLRDILGGQR